MQLKTGKEEEYHNDVKKDGGYIMHTKNGQRRGNNLSKSPQLIG